MKIKVGDKVKFLNENGGGIVSRIIDSKTVDVTIEDGFEIPTFIGDLIVIEPSSSDSAKNLFDTDFNIKIPGLVRDLIAREIETSIKVVYAPYKN